MQTASLILSLYQIGAIQFGEFTLKSGATSKIYLDLRQIVSYPAILRHVAEEMCEKIHDVSCDFLCGVPYAALPIATCISLQQNIPMLMCRKETKMHGTKRKVEGAFSAGQRCLIIEDVITTGSSVLETANELRSAGLIVQDVIALIDREQGGTQHLKEQGYTLHALFALHDIMHELKQSGVLSLQENHIIDELLQCNA